MGVGFRGWCSIRRTTPDPRIHTFRGFPTILDRVGWCSAEQDPFPISRHCGPWSRDRVSIATASTDNPGQYRRYGILAVSWDKKCCGVMIE